jgi:hypothetical protein
VPERYLTAEGGDDLSLLAPFAARQFGPRSHCGVQRRVLLEDPLLQGLEQGAGVEAEFLVERRARALVGLERFGLTPRPVQRQHPLSLQPLSQRMTFHQGIQLRDQGVVASQRELGLDAFLDRGEAKLLEPPHVGLGPRLVGEVRQRRAPPERQGLAQLGDRPFPRTAGARLLALFHQVLEAEDVELLRLDPQGVAGRTGDQDARRGSAGPLRLQRLAKLGHVHLQGVARGFGGGFRPQEIDQAVAGHDLVVVEQQQRQQRPLLGRAEGHVAVACDGFQGAEKSEPQHLPIVPM